jgi:hypothetical protein
MLDPWSVLPSSSVLLSDRLAVLQRKVFRQRFLQRLIGEQLVQNLSHVIDKDKLDSFLDTWRDVFVNVRLACRRYDQF